MSMLSIASLQDLPWRARWTRQARCTSSGKSALMRLVGVVGGSDFGSLLCTVDLLRALHGVRGSAVEIVSGLRGRGHLACEGRCRDDLRVVHVYVAAP